MNIPSKQKILVSSCLVGKLVRYDGKIKEYDLSLFDEYEQVLVCPEVDGGLKTPRSASEIQPNGRVVNIDGDDLSVEFEKGANLALLIAKKYHIKVAILKSNSPSCSNNMIYDGTFSGNLIKGLGKTVQLLEKNGIKVFNETQMDEAFDYLSSS